MALLVMCLQLIPFRWELLDVPPEVAIVFTLVRRTASAISSPAAANRTQSKLLARAHQSQVTDCFINSPVY